MGAIDTGCKVYYPNKAVRDAKEQIMPNIRDGLSVTNYLASVNLQNSLDHNAACLVNLQKDLLLQKPDNYVIKLVITEQQINLFTSSHVMKMC